MTLAVEIKDDDSDIRARVTKYGQLVTAPLSFSVPTSASMTLINTAYNLIEPQPGQSIIITNVIASADKLVSNTDPADVVVYQSDGVNSLNNLGTLIRPQLLRGANQNFLMNLIVGEGVWVNATTNDDAILLFLYYYYVPAPKTI